MASFECIPRFFSCCSGAVTGEVVVLFELLKAAAMADTGSETEERRGGRRARKKVEENSLSNSYWDIVSEVSEGRMVVYISRADF